jgi:hypothetical protein
MNILNTVITEIRNAFGFPQLAETPSEPAPQPKITQTSYTVLCGDDSEDYSDYLGIGA